MKKLGILGGMGPLATCDLFKKVVENTVAGCDNEHIHIIIDNNSSIPDRTAAILRGGADPLPQMKASLQRLTEAGADVVIMGCNTAHYFYDALGEDCKVERLNMLYETM
ncbi:MAG: amino acid racemase, partial [Oscillospiraceae bacterium]|nr:amino acid racemase [Oscillospiraceae bacterium]